MADSSSDLLCPIEFRYGRPTVRALFTRQARLDRALQVEAALARAQASVGLIPAEAAEAIARAVDRHAVRLERVDELEAELRHDVMAIARALAEASGPAGAWVHFGATSADITETALAIELRESMGVLAQDVKELVGTLMERAQQHRATPEIARTHGQFAVPQSFGYKLAVAAAEFGRHWTRLKEIAPRVAAGKIAGAVGTGAGYGPRASEVEALALRPFGVIADEAPTQLVGRDRLAEFTNWAALVAASAERWATEVRNLQRSEIREVAEPFDESKQVGSSTMAQKRNPMASETVSSLARLVRALAGPPLDNMIQWHERDLANSANERFVVPHVVVLLDDILQRLTTIVRGLTIDERRMAENLASAAGLPMTESLMLALTAKGMARSDAHELLRQITRPGDGRSLTERALAESRVTRLLSPEEIRAATDPRTYVAAAAAKCDRLLAHLERTILSA